MWVINVGKNTNAKDAKTSFSLPVGQASRLSINYRGTMHRTHGRTVLFFLKEIKGKVK